MSDGEGSRKPYLLAGVGRRNESLKKLVSKFTSEDKHTSDLEHVHDPDIIQDRRTEHDYRHPIQTIID